MSGGSGEASSCDVHVSEDVIKVGCFPWFVDVGPIAGAINFGQQVSKGNGVNACLNLALVDGFAGAETLNGEHGLVLINSMVTSWLSSIPAGLPRQQIRTEMPANRVLMAISS